MHELQTNKSTIRRAAAIALAIFVFNVPWENTVVIKEVGTLTRLIGIGVFVLSVATVLVEKKHRASNGALRVLFVLIFWEVCSLYWTKNPELTSTRVKTSLQLYIMVLIIWEVIRDEKDVARLLIGFICGGYVSIIGTYYSFYGHVSPYLIDKRYVAKGFDPNELGITLAIGIPIAWYLSNNVVHKVGLRRVARAYVPLSALAIMLTASRTAFLALVAALLYIPWTMPMVGIRKKIGAMAVIILTLLAARAVIPATSIERISTIREELLFGGVGQRLEIWEAGLQNFVEHPVFGVGFGAFPDVFGYSMRHRNVVHNTFLAILFELGVVGLCIFLCVIALLLKVVAEFAKDERILWMFIGLVWLVGAMALSWEGHKLTWMLFGLAMAHARAMGGTRENG